MRKQQAKTFNYKFFASSEVKLTYNEKVVLNELFITVVKEQRMIQLCYRNLGQ